MFFASFLDGKPSPDVCSEVLLPENLLSLAGNISLSQTLLRWMIIYLWASTGFMFLVFFFQIMIPNCRYFTALLCFPHISAEIISEQTVSFSFVVIGKKK